MGPTSKRSLGIVGSYALIATPVFIDFLAKFIIKNIWEKTIKLGLFL